MLMSQGHAAASGHTDLGGLYSHSRPGWCLWSGLLPRTLSGSMELLQEEAEVWGLCCPGKLFGGPWPPTDWEEYPRKLLLLWYQWLEAHSREGGTWEVLVTTPASTPTSPKTTAKTWSHRRELFSSITWILSSSCPWLTASARVWEGKDI